MTIPLSQLELQKQVKISQIDNEDLLIKLVELGVMPGIELSIQNKAPFNGPLSLLVNGTRIIIRKKEAKAILVEAI